LAVTQPDCGQNDAFNSYFEGRRLPDGMGPIERKGLKTNQTKDRSPHLLVLGGCGGGLRWEGGSWLASVWNHLHRRQLLGRKDGGGQGCLRVCECCGKLWSQAWRLQNLWFWHRSRCFRGQCCCRRLAQSCRRTGLQGMWMREK